LKNDFDILVIGAGISGLASARALQDQGFSVAILEKSRGLGGRMATRRDENGLWDHGVPWLSNGVRREWDGLNSQDWIQVENLSEPFWVHPKGMTQIAKDLAKPLTIFRECRAIRLSWNAHSKKWSVDTESNSTFSCSVLILSAPAPQNVELLERSNLLEGSDLLNTLRNIQYRPQIVALGILHNPKTALWTSTPQEPFELLIDQKMKGLQTSEGYFAAYLDETWSRKYFDSPDPEVSQLIQELLEYRYGIHPQPIQVKRWRYSQCKNPLKEAYLKPSALPLYLIGDAFAQGSLIGALKSACSLAQSLKSD